MVKLITITMTSKAATTCNTKQTVSFQTLLTKLIFFRRLLSIAIIDVVFTAVNTEIRTKNTASDIFVPRSHTVFIPALTIAGVLSEVVRDQISDFTRKYVVPP